MEEGPSGRGVSVGWTRERIIFLSISAALVVALLWWSSEVLLPFILALVIAYVLTPLVALCERGRIPRAASILLVYAVTLGLIYVSIAAIAPSQVLLISFLLSTPILSTSSCGVRPPA